MMGVIKFADEDEADHYQKFIGNCSFICCNGYLNALEFEYTGVFD